MPDNASGSAYVGGWLTAVGAAGVVVITGIYALAPPLASVPLPAGIAWPEVLDATRNSLGRLRAAGTIGTIADILLIAGALLLAAPPEKPVGQRLFWLWTALSTLFFVLVDVLAAAIIPALALIGGDDIDAFVAARSMFDAFFALGVLTFGAALVAGWWAGDAWPAPLRALSLALGLLSVLAFLLHMAGATQPLLLGVTVGLAGLLLAWLGWRETAM